MHADISLSSSPIFSSLIFMIHRWLGFLMLQMEFSLLSFISTSFCPCFAITHHFISGKDDFFYFIVVCSVIANLRERGRQMKTDKSNRQACSPDKVVVPKRRYKRKIKPKGLPLSSPSGVLSCLENSCCRRPREKLPYYYVKRFKRTGKTS